MMWQSNNNRPRLGQCFSVVLLSFFCIIGWGIGESPFWERIFASGLGGPGAPRLEGSLLSGVFVFLSGVDPWYPPGVLARGLPRSIPCARTSTAAARGRFVEPAERDLDQGELLPGNRPCEVAIYHTHSGETYLPLHGKSRVDGKNGGVSLIGDEITSCLEKDGIVVVHDLTIHDYPDYPTSYIKSAKTAKRLVEENPELKVLIDLHRDAGIPKKETVQVDEETAARILLVVGNGQRLPNPHWQENYAFARRIANLLEEKYPGIVKAVRLKDGRYNQHLSPRAILVEIGSDKNTLEEGLVAGRCLAAVLAELIIEEGFDE